MVGERITLGVTVSSACRYGPLSPPVLDPGSLSAHSLGILCFKFLYTYSVFQLNLHLAFLLCS